ncbi:MAG: HAD-IC family P-type ATPase [Dyadobacter sp.]|uniref:HAD-IC family P-type ATPase n=1 Tax=Dyadobacter sp. TaxID=1914288 RepID=UPI003267AF94
MEHSMHQMHDMGGADHHRMMIADFKKRFYVILALTVPIAALSSMIQQFLGVNWQFAGSSYILCGLSTVVFFYGGWPFLKGLVTELKAKNPGMMTLIGFAITVSYLYSTATVFGLNGMDFYWELATLILVMLLGHWIEMKSIAGASKELELLVRLMPSDAHKVVGYRVEEVKTDTLKQYDIILVKPGERIAADGLVSEGESYLNESMLTGESKPVKRISGDKVIAGSINGNGAIKVTVSHAAKDSYLSKVIKLVHDAQKAKSQTQLLADNRSAFENARKITTVVFDKTGTLTIGKFEVSKVVSLKKEIVENEIIRLSASLEQKSEHPIATGILQKAKDLSLNMPAAENFNAITGQGIQAMVEGKSVQVVSPGYLREHNMTVKDLETNDTETVVYLIIDNELTGYIALSDQIRPESAAAIRTLKANNIRSVLLTGDNEKVAKSVSETLVMDSFTAEVLPEQKLEKIKELQKSGAFVAMTGDGVNDAPALAQANIGIAVGSGSDIAAETAGIVLVNSNPKDIVSLILFGKATHRKMIQNLIWATAYNIVALPLAAGVLYRWGILLNPAVGAALMAVSTIIVAINASMLKVK